MKHLLLVALTVSAGVCFVACRRAKPPSPPVPPAAAASDATAVTGPAQAVDPKRLPDAPPIEVDHSAITTALRNYVADRQINPKLVTDLNVLVPKYLPSLPPPPPGKKYVWSNTLVVSLANK